MQQLCLTKYVGNLTNQRHAQPAIAQHVITCPQQSHSFAANIFKHSSDLHVTQPKSERSGDGGVTIEVADER